jgi:hypothetical protein
MAAHAGPMLGQFGGSRPVPGTFGWVGGLGLLGRLIGAVSWIGWDGTVGTGGMVGTVSGWDGDDGRVSCYGAAQSPTSTMSILPIPVQPKPPRKGSKFGSDCSNWLEYHIEENESPQSHKVLRFHNYCKSLAQAALASCSRFLQKCKFLLCGFGAEYVDAHAAAHSNRRPSDFLA